MIETLFWGTLLFVGQAIFIYFILNDIFVRYCLYLVVRNEIPQTLIEQRLHKIGTAPFYLIMIDLVSYLGQKRKKVASVKIILSLEVLAFIVFSGLPYLVFLISAYKSDEMSLSIFGLIGTIAIFGGLYTIIYKANKLFG